MAKEYVERGENLDARYLRFVEGSVERMHCGGSRQALEAELGEV